jgi:hypothetical protein
MSQPQPTPQCHSQLAQASRDHELVQVERALPGADPIEGYVVTLGPEWVLLSVLTEGAPDGWTGLRTSDVRSVVHAPSGPFVQRGLVHRENWPPQAPLEHLVVHGGVQELLASAGAGFSLLVLHREQADPLSCMVGRPAALTSDRLEWRHLSPDGVWEPGSDFWELSTITRIDVGTQYALALGRAAELHALVTLPNEQQSSGHASGPEQNSAPPFRLHALS